MYKESAPTDTSIHLMMKQSFSLIQNFEEKLEVELLARPGKKFEPNLL